MTLFNAWDFASGWLSVAVASSKDDSRPALNRTVLIEAFDTGVRLTATDAFLLLTAWVPNLDNEFEGPPGWDEAPYGVAVAIDPHGRGRGLLGHALGLAVAAENNEDPDPVEVRLELGVIDQADDGRSMFAGFEAPFVVVELPGVERVKLRTYEGEFPSWRQVLAGFRAERTASVGLSSERMGQLAKLAKYHPSRALLFSLGGDDRAVHVAVQDRHIEGVVMPVRTDWSTGEPLDPVDDQDQEGTA